MLANIVWQHLVWHHCITGLKAAHSLTVPGSSCNSGNSHLQVMKIGQVIRDEFDGKKDLSGIGGVESGRDAAEFLLLGANTVQVSMLCP